jgi:transcriptional regulator with XRE-family HTH domain
MTTIHKRIQEERKRLGFTQAEMAERIGITKKTQINWENGVAAPRADALAAYLAAGVDVWYVLTAQKRPPLTPHAGK